MKNIFSSRDFLSLLQVKVLVKMLIKIFAWSVKTISGLDSQSKFQIFRLFSSRHVGVLRRYIDMVAPYWALQICAKYFDKHLKFGKTYRLVVFIYLLKHDNFLTLYTEWFSNAFFLLLDSATQEYAEYVAFCWLINMGAATSMSVQFMIILH